VGGVGYERPLPLEGLARTAHGSAGHVEAAEEGGPKTPERQGEEDEPAYRLLNPFEGTRILDDRTCESSLPGRASGCPNRPARSDRLTNRRYRLDLFRDRL
jgi:hypothetical protein